VTVSFPSEIPRTLLRERPGQECHFLAPLLARFEARYARAAGMRRRIAATAGPVASLDDYRIALFRTLTGHETLP
jgi:hypothetical protein